MHLPSELGVGTVLRFQPRSQWSSAMGRFSKYLAWTVVILLIIAVAAYVIARSGLSELDDAASEELGGLYLQTEKGVL